MILWTKINHSQFFDVRKEKKTFQLFTIIFAVRLQTESKLAKYYFFGEKKNQGKSYYCWPTVDLSAISYVKDTELSLELIQMSIKIVAINYDNLR